MNYGKKGVHKKQKALHSTSAKWGRKLVLTLFNVALIAIVASGILVASAGFGLFRGIIETAPEIGNINVQPTGFSTFVYDIDGNQTAKLIAENSNRIPVTMDMIPEDLATLSSRSKTNVFMSITASTSKELFVPESKALPQGIFRKERVPLRSSC